MHENADGFLFYVYIFGMIFWGWLNGSMYYDLHGTPGIRTNLTTLWQMLVVAALGVTLNFDNDPNYFYLTVALAFLQGYITYLWWSVGIYDKDHRRLNIPFTVCYLLNVLLLFAALYVRSPFKGIIYWSTLIINYLPAFFIYKIMKRQSTELNLSPSMTERLGLFTIIVFGEVILGVINGMHGSDGHSKRPVGLFCARHSYRIFFVADIFLAGSRQGMQARIYARAIFSIAVCANVTLTWNYRRVIFYFAAAGFGDRSKSNC